MSRKIAFIANQKFFHQQKTLRTSLKATFYAQKLLLHMPFFAVRKKFPFLQTKSLSFSQIFPYCYPKQLFSTLHLPFALSLTYCPPKNTAVLLISALNPYAVKPERRTDSNHCRRYPEKCSFQHSRVLDECRLFSLQKRIDRRFESWVAGLRPACFLVTFCTMQKVTTRTSSQEAPSFCKPRFSPPQ